MDKKKEYVAPEMDVFEYVVKTSLLQGSPNNIDQKVGAPTVNDIEFD